MITMEKNGCLKISTIIYVNNLETIIYIVLIYKHYI